MSSRESLWLKVRSAAAIIAHHTIRERALTDPLTGLGNRRKLGAELESAFAADGDSLLLLFDLDGFKDYNDRFGHLAGDQLLSRLGAKLRRAVDGSGRAYRSAAMSSVRTWIWTARTPMR